MKNQFLKNCAALLIFALALSLSGCAKWFNPMGDNKYDCNRKENPDSPYCHSFRSVEEATSNDIPSSRYDEKMSIEEADRRAGIAPKKSKSKKNSRNSKDNEGGETHQFDVDGTKTGSALPKGSPIRVGPVVQRTWIKSFDDNNDILISDLYVYKEVVPTHWAGRMPGNGYQGAASGGMTGAYPHKPIPATTAPQITNNEPGQSAANSDFNQPGTSNDEPVPRDVSDTSMPN